MALSVLRCDRRRSPRIAPVSGMAYQGTPMTPTSYRTIVADPPWPYAGSGPWGNGGTVRPGHMRAKRPSPSSVEQYGSMTLDQLSGLKPPAATNAHLYLWTTNSFLEQSFSIARAWGFVPKTVCTWVKTHQADAERVSMKSGYYFRGATEHFLFCMRGSLPFTTDEAFPTAYLWPRLPHSVKPDAFYDLVETVSPAPRLELFARRQRFGWDTWGDQALEHVEVMV